MLTIWFASGYGDNVTLRAFLTAAFTIFSFLPSPLLRLFLPSLGSFLLLPPSSVHPHHLSLITFSPPTPSLHRHHVPNTLWPTVSCTSGCAESSSRPSPSSNLQSSTETDLQLSHNTQSNSRAKLQLRNSIHIFTSH